MPEEAPLVRALLPEGAFFSVVKPITGDAEVRYAQVFGNEAIGERERAEEKRRKYQLVMKAYETPLEGDPLSGVEGISNFYREMGFDVNIKAARDASGKVVKGFKAIYIRKA